MVSKKEVKSLQDIANILRRDSIKATTAAGSGHPTSCMSCAEIMACLFFNEMKWDVGEADNPNNDEFILSKGHAAPILYSTLFRAGAIKHNLISLRKISSPLEGHPMPNSLDWVKVATGSLGQGLSVGLGMALAAKLQKRKYSVFVLMGDSEMAEGSVYEALQLASHYKLNNLVGILDANRLGQRGETMIGHDVSEYKKRFASFGWDVIVVNGHNIKDVLRGFTFARKSRKPCMIIAKTFKGQGVSWLKNKENWHGKPVPFDKLKEALEEIGGQEMPSLKIRKPGKVSWKTKIGKVKNYSYPINIEVATRTAYGKALAAIAVSDSRVLAVDAEVSNSTHSDEVKKKSPGQFIETYIAEQDMIGIALGLSKKGFNVFASTFSAFLSRAHDQLRMAALSSADLTIAGSHSGVSIGEDGASQMGLEDIAIFRDLPGSIVLYPSDAVSTQNLMQHMGHHKGIKYIRTSRPKSKVLYYEDEKFPFGEFKVLMQSRKDKAVLVGAGVTVHESMRAHSLLKSKGINTAVVDLYCIKPFDREKFIKFVRQHGGKIVVAEDHYRAGGIGEMLSSAIENTGLKIVRLCVSKIPHSGTKDQLLEKYKINWQHIALAVRSMRGIK